jgi:serine/threonine protein kinase/tetratricopeptide (TPR) repeat protein
MTPERWTQVKEAAAEALAQAPDARAAHLAAMAMSDPDLGRQVADLLTHYADDTFLERPAIAEEAEPGPPPGTMFGPYQIQSLLGRGGMGRVFLAQERALDRPVALKFLSPALQRQQQSRRRFLSEAKAAAALDHPYICKIYQAGEEEGCPFIAMEYVRGETLRRRLGAGPLPLKDALRVAVEVSEALETAHAAGIVHRDLNPSNIMLTTGGHAKVLDFGVATRLADARGVYTQTGTSRTNVGAVQGTVAYMSPEQVRGQEVDVRSDIFSLGVVLSECMTGTNPFQADSPIETAWQILNRAPALPGLAPGGVQQIVNRMLAKAPEDRYQSVHELRADLARAIDDVNGANLRGDGRGGRSSPRLLTRRRAVMAVAGAAVAIAGAAWWDTRTPPRNVSNNGPRSLAVLPFVNSSGDPQDDYLATGIAQAVTTRLHRAALRVIPWETARRFRDPSNPAQVARELGIGAVLSGRFETHRDRLRITVSLVEASGVISWTGEFDESLADIFQVQTRIARGVAGNLGYALTGPAAATLARAESSSADAYDFYLQGAEHLQQGDRESVDVAFDFFERAVRIDPELTEAHIGLGAAYLERFWSGWGGGPGNLTLAEKAFHTALQKDPRNMRARRGLNLTAWHRGTGDSHLQFARDAARLGEDDIETLLARAEALTTDGPEELATSILERVLALDPLNQSAAWHFPTAYHNAERFADAVKAADNYVQRFGADPFVDMMAANALEHLGKVDAARDRFGRASDPLMQGSLKPGLAPGYGLTALLEAGNFHSRHGQRPRAVPLWQRGLEVARAALANDPDSIGMRLYCASFLCVLGNLTELEQQERDAMARAEAADLNPWELRHLAAAHAHVGNTGRAIDILRTTLQRGRLHGRPWLFAPMLEHAAGFDALRREYRAAELQRRRLVSPAP